ncbi:MAG: V-type ATP synthase subunit C [Eubacteriales bacterium SKADARSKE-1]|nr:V-type ATP synthase subunit C [Eubacteriales bacterium SKADARSKE-1]
MACRDYNECLKFIKNKGWGASDNANDIDKILAFEMQKTKNFIYPMVSDINSFNVILYPIDYNNLKAAIKSTVIMNNTSNLFLSGGSIDYQVMLKAVKEGNFNVLPEHMKNVAQKAFNILLHTSDSQASDSVIDKALLDAMMGLKKESSIDLIKKYAELFVASANIKIAIRGQMVAKDITFFKKAMSECDSLDIDALIKAATKSSDAIFEYLQTTKYSEAIPFLKKSVAEFEKWYDNKVVECIQLEKSNYFTIAPILAYVLARENEIKVVRIIFSGKLNKINDDIIKERLRYLYA